jgi:hypothetical protein
MKTVVQEGIRYTAVSGCALIIDIAVLFILVHYLSWWYVAAAPTSFLPHCQRGAAGFTFVWNFVARRRFLLVQRRTV